jgi:hypothetical protein
MNFKILCKGFRDHNKPVGRSHYLKSKLILIMKLTTILITVCCLHVSAAGYSQNITLSETNAPLKKILQLIRKQTGFQLLYDSQLLEKSNRVTLSIVNTPIEVVLDKIFGTQPFSYKIFDRTILVKEKERIALPVAVRKADVTVMGIVRDADDKPIYLASVKVKGSDKTVVTNRDGAFSITVPEIGTVLVCLMWVM